MIDTHAHLDDIQYADDLDDVVLRARSAGVEKILLPSVSMTEHDKVLAVEARYPGFCHAMIGIHPEEINAQNINEQLAMFDERITQRQYIAVGEIGLDLYCDKTYFEEQKTAFLHQASVAVDMSLPVAIHVRDAFQPTVDIIRQLDRSRLRGVWHCFTGAVENARTVLSLGDFYFGIGGVSTFKNAKFTERLNEIPLDRILLETDAPFLAPTPMRGKRNESSYLVHIRQKLAQIYGKTEEEIDEITTKNAKTLFF